MKQTFQKGKSSSYDLNKPSVRSGNFYDMARVGRSFLDCLKSFPSDIYLQYHFTFLIMIQSKQSLFIYVTYI